MNLKKHNLCRTSINIFVALLFITNNVYAQKPEKEMLDKGKDYFKKKMYDEAIISFNTAIQLKPRYAAAYYHRGNAYAEKGNLNEAISDYAKAIEINPNYAEAYYKRGLAYSNGGNFDQAISDYDKAIEINPELAGAYCSRATLYCSKREYDKSWQDIHRVEALGRNPNPEFLKQLKRLSGREK